MTRRNMMRRRSGNMGREMAGVTGLEPATSGVTGRRSNQLSYTPEKREKQAPLKSRRFSDVALGLSSDYAGATPLSARMSQGKTRYRKSAMKLDQIVLIIVVVLAIGWVLTVAGGMVSVMPWGLLGLVPLAIFIAILWRVIYQRLNNAEDDYYEKNVDK